MSLEEYEAIDSVYTFLNELTTEACLSLGHENAVSMEEYRFLKNSEKLYHEIWKKAVNEYYNSQIL
ncbi:MAG: hypothetical protein J5965_10920 [Aeriscardovia sp.]|nr:hypothetical protein [Aeriscardovia sp.]